MGTQELSLDPTERVHLADILPSQKTVLIRLQGGGLLGVSLGEGWMCSVGGREWNASFVTQSPDCCR